MVRRTCAVCADDDDEEKDVVANKRAEQKRNSELILHRFLDVLDV
jgi:hypothetical protein